MGACFSGPLPDGGYKMFGKPESFIKWNNGTESEVNGGEKNAWKT
jgi:hypothetical protein